jgi:hypothetical protein
VKALALLLLLPACALPEGTLNDQEVITTVILQFGDAEFAFDDPDGDGGELPTIDPIMLAPGDYALAVRFENRLEDPPEDITEEVADESDQHLVLFTGSAVVGPATANTEGPLQHAYDDADANGLPIGLANQIVVSPGEGMLTVTLRHLPPELPPEKSADTTAEARANGIDSIGGATDAQVSFSVGVQ